MVRWQNPVHTKGAHLCHGYKDTRMFAKEKICTENKSFEGSNKRNSNSYEKIIKVFSKLANWNNLKKNIFKKHVKLYLRGDIYYRFLSDGSFNPKGGGEYHF